MDEKGWYKPNGALKAHYFIDGDSICGAWKNFGGNEFHDADHKNKDNCKKCQTIRNAKANAAE